MVYLEDNENREIKTTDIILDNLKVEQKITIGHLTYHAGRLWNQANFYLKNNPALGNSLSHLCNKLRDSIHFKSLPINVAKRILKEVIEDADLRGKVWFINPKFPHKEVILGQKEFKVDKNNIKIHIPDHLKNYLSERFGISCQYLLIDISAVDINPNHDIKKPDDILIKIGTVIVPDRGVCHKLTIIRVFNKITVGSTVILYELKEKKRYKYKIVGKFSSNPEKGEISEVSPLGKELIGKKKGDIVRHGKFKYLVKKVT